MTTKSDRPEHWALRASSYGQLKWVSNRRLLDFMVACAELKPHHRLLDAGTGNGAVAQACAPHVREVLAVDFCHDMLAQRNTNQHHNLRFEVADLRQLPYPDACFDRVTARNVFHNILAERDRLRAALECCRVLAEGGKFVLSEGVPPVPELREDFRHIFALKEERVVFTPDDLCELLRAAGFRRVEVRELADPGFDVNNWVDNDGTLSEERKQQIIRLHTEGSELFRRVYNVRQVDGRVYIDTKAAYAIGTK